MNKDSKPAKDYKLSKSEEVEYTKVYKEYRQDILRYVNSRVNSREIAVDMTSKIFIKLFTNWHGIEMETVRAWLYTVAKNELIDYYRAKKEKVSLTDIFYIDDSGNTTEKEAVKEIKKDKLRSAIQDLDEETQEIVTLKVYEELTFKEISKVLELKKGAVKMRYYRAIDQIDESLSEAEDKKEINSKKL
jgi:RNA polymerase sigma-70 factor (ECF subfamily)